MAEAKATTTTDEPTIHVLRTDTCSTSSGKSTLGYEIGTDESDGIYLRVATNDGGGFFSNEWVKFEAICDAIADWPEGQGITSMTFRKIFRGKSANTPGFLVAVLNAVGILEPEGEKKRVHQTRNPEHFLAQVEALRKGANPKAKPKRKAPAKAKAKAAPKTKATKTKTPRKSPARKRPARSKKASLHPSPPSESRSDGLICTFSVSH